MKPSKLVIALVILIGTMAPEVASADRGDRGFDRFQQRHDIFKRDGFAPRGHALRDRGLGFRSRGGEFRNRSDAFRPRGDFVKRGGSAFRHRAEPFGQDYRAVPVRRGHRHHSHTRFGLFVGVPLYWNWPPPYYAYPPTVVTVPAPPPTVYIERGYDEPAPAAGYWYYCDSPDGYYPYVRECPGGWQRVAPTPAR